MGPKRASSADGPSAPKLSKTEHNTPEDFSNSVKKKLSASTRTGQACDRCKVRKIRCDGRLGGCTPCMQNHTPCKTTDRITGRATTRGHAEALEAENAYLKQVISDLQGQLRDLGVEVKPITPMYTGYSSVPVPASQPAPWAGMGDQNPGVAPWTDQSSFTADPHNMLSYPGHTADGAAHQSIEETILRSLPAYKSAFPGDNYLGVSSGHSVLSPIKGMSLTLFGTEIDLADFVPDDQGDDTFSTTSYQHTLRVIMKREEVEQLDLPAYEEAHQHALWYIRSLNPYMPILSKPGFMNLLYRIYHEPSYTATTAEIVIVHMVLALIKYQVAIRNAQPAWLEEANKHYRFSLSKVYDLVTSHTIVDVQAMTLICIHIRNFPKPGAAWLMCQMTLSMAIELGLNRSVKAWADTAPKRDSEEVELRKRLFWTIHGLHVGLSGKLGRPMPLRMEDVDVEMPEPMIDALPDETLTDFHRCSFHIGIIASKMGVLFNQMYSTLYAVRQQPDTYETTLRKLEDGLRQWRDNAPRELTDPERIAPEDRIFSLYVECWGAEYDLLLHHPAVCRSSNPQVISANLTVCLNASNQMLRTAEELRKARSLDIPWINCTTHIAAIFTALFVHSQRKDELTSTDLLRLRGDMDMWLVVMGEFGQLLGTGPRLRNALQQIIDRSLNNINDHLVQKTASAASAAAATDALTNHPHPETPGAAHAFSSNGGYAPAFEGTPGSSNDTKPYIPPEEPTLTPSTAYPVAPSSGPYQYQEPSATVPAYPQTNTNAFDQPAYSVPDSDLDVAQAAHAAAVASAATATAASAATRPQSTAYMYNPPAPTAGAPSASSGQLQDGIAANAAWRQWTQNAVTNLTPQDFARPQDHLYSANALMALGGRDAAADAITPGTAATPGVTSMPATINGHAQPVWPVVSYHMQDYLHQQPQQQPQPQPPPPHVQPTPPAQPQGPGQHSH